MVEWLSFLVFAIPFCVAIIFGGLSARSDLRGMVIPNKYSVVVLGAFVFAYAGVHLFGAPIFFSPLSHILAGGLVFAVTLVLFGFGLIGAADSKLASAYAFWVGMQGVLVFLFYMAVFGGVLGLMGLYISKRRPFKSPLEGSWVAQVQGGASKVPYGVAIVGGALASFAKLGYFSFDLYGSLF